MEAPALLRQQYPTTPGYDCPEHAWKVASKDASGVTLRQEPWTLRVVQGQDGTWHVDSGDRCPKEG